MKLARVIYKNEKFFCMLKGEEAIRIKKAPYSGIVPDGRRYELKDVKLLAPCKPSKIVAVGLNYRGHGEELGMQQPSDPIIFIKPNTAVIAHGDKIVRPDISKRVDYEAELGVVISRKCRSVSAQEARKFVLGFTCFNDVTARDLQKIDGQWTRAKSFDTFAPIGPWIETELDENNLRIEARIEGKSVQSANTSQMIVPPMELVSFISKVMTLYPGDVIATGTPTGVGEILSGQSIEIYIEGIGSLINKCI